MAQHTSTIRGPSRVIINSFGQSTKSTSKTADVNEQSLTDHSIFIGYGSNAKRIKDRWETTKKQLRFENNYVALKWLLDSFVDDYLRSKNMEDTATLTQEKVKIKKERSMEDVSPSTHSRRPASHSPSKTRFEDTIVEGGKENGIWDKSQSRGNHSELRQHVIKDRKSGEVSRMVSGDLHVPGQYPYKYIPDYSWSPYYWHNNLPMNSRMMNVDAMPRYSGYIVKTPSCSSLPTRDTYKSSGGALRSGATESRLKRFNWEEKNTSSSSFEKRPAVNLGFKTKSMPNLQSIQKETEVNSEEEEESLSDPESQGDLIALSSLSMPNLRKIPPDPRTPLLSPPPRGQYEPAPLLRDRHDVCNPSSFSMPNLQTIPGIEHDSRKKTIRDFVINRLSGSKEHESGEMKSKMFTPNGFYPPSAVRDSERKLVIRERLLNRMAKRKREESSEGTQYNGGLTSAVNSHLKFASSTLSRVPESRLWSENSYIQTGATATRDMRMLNKDDHVNNNNWKIPRSVASSEQQMRNVWNRSPMKKSHNTAGIWNPADVHVKREGSPPSAAENEVTTQGVIAPSVPQGDEVVSRPPSSHTSSDDRRIEEVNTDVEVGCRTSGDEEEHVDVENVKDEIEETGESDSELDDDTSDDGKKSKRTRKTDQPRKRLKAV